MDVAGIDEETDVICWLIIPTPSWDRRVLPQRIAFLSLIFPINANVVIPHFGSLISHIMSRTWWKKAKASEYSSVVTCVTNPRPLYRWGDNPPVDICWICNHCGKILNIFNFHMIWYHGMPPTFWTKNWKLLKSGGTKKLLTMATCATNPRPLYRGGDNPLDPPQPHPT